MDIQTLTRYKDKTATDVKHFTHGLIASYADGSRRWFMTAVCGDRSMIMSGAYEVRGIYGRLSQDEPALARLEDPFGFPWPGKYRLYRDEHYFHDDRYWYCACNNRARSAYHCFMLCQPCLGIVQKEMKHYVIDSGPKLGGYPENRSLVKFYAPVQMVFFDPRPGLDVKLLLWVKSFHLFLTFSEGSSSIQSWLLWLAKLRQGPLGCDYTYYGAIPGTSIRLTPCKNPCVLLFAEMEAVPKMRCKKPSILDLVDLPVFLEASYRALAHFFTSGMADIYWFHDGEEEKAACRAILSHMGYQAMA